VSLREKAIPDAHRMVEPDRVERRGWYTLGLIVALTLFSFVDRQVLILASEPMVRELGLTDAELGMIQGLAFALFTLAGSYPVAWAADRFDRRLVVMICVAVWTAGTVFCGVAQNFGQMFAAATIMAAGEAGLAPIALSAVADLFFGRKRATANAVYYLSASAGVSAGMALGGLAFAAIDSAHAMLPAALGHFSAWRLAFFAAAAPAPLFLIATAFGNLRRQGHAQAPETPVRSTSVARFVLDHRGAVGGVFGAIALYMVGFGALLPWIPVALTRMFQTSAAENGYGMGVAVAIGSLCGVSIANLLLRRALSLSASAPALSVAVPVLAAGIPMAAVLPFIATAVQGFALVGLMLVVGTAIGSLLPSVLQAMAPPSLRGRMMSLYLISTSLAAGGSPTLVGWLSTHVFRGDHQLLIVLAVVTVLSWTLGALLFSGSRRAFERLTMAVVRAGA